MQYIIQTNFESELQARKEYLYLVFHLWFIETKREDGFIILNSIPGNKVNVYMIYGHHNEVAQYLKKHNQDIGQNILVINSCFPDKMRKQLGTIRNVFYSKVNELGFAVPRDGKAFRINFNITDSELDLLNVDTECIIERISMAYKKVA
jgi:hypothetical protein